MKKFSEYLSESLKEITFTFGRFNPPTNGHEKLLDKVASVAKGGAYRVYPSHSIDPKKNPLGFDEKVKFMRKMFPKHARSIVAEKDAKTAIHVLVKLYDEGYRVVNMVVGSDRVDDFSSMLKKYNGVKGKHGFYDFTHINIVSAGERDPDSDDVSGMSASKLRAAAASNDLEVFTKGMPSGFKEVQKLFNAIRKGMGLKESYDFRKHVRLETVSEAREAYIKGALFREGDLVECAGVYGQVAYLGSNYVLVEFTDGSRKRKWLTDVKLVTEDVSEKVKRFSISEMGAVVVNQDNVNKYSSIVKKMHEQRIKRG
jgi:hypothetical protein